MSVRVRPLPQEDQVANAGIGHDLQNHDNVRSIRILISMSYLCNMWKHDDKIHVNDPTLKIQIIRTDPDPALSQFMRDEIKQVKRKRIRSAILYYTVWFVLTFILCYIFLK